MSRFDQDDSTFARKLTGLEASIERVNQRIGRDHYVACPMGVRMLANDRPLCEHSMELCTECQPCDCGHSFRPFIVGDTVKLRTYVAGTDGTITKVRDRGTLPPRYFVKWGPGGESQYDRTQLQRVIL